ncbi:neutral/alkaline non-lysosomal ceramidase N-terminal domain-containing protein [Mucilaginibacter boryungensis]
MTGVSVRDITPPLEVGLLTSSVKGTYKPFESVSSPLNAKALVFRFNDEYVVIVSLDLLNLNDTGVGGWREFKKGLSDAIAPERIIICCTHTHCAPESGGASNLYLTDSYKIWIAYIRSQIKDAINEAVANIKPCNLKISASRLDGFSLQRRIKTPEGNIIMSDSIQPIAPELFDREPVDRRVNTLYFRDMDENAIATIVHAICHPVHEMCIPKVSSEFPGEMCLTLDTLGGYGTSVFLNGAAGNTNPPTVSVGKEYARKHGQALANVAMEKSGLHDIDTSVFDFVHIEKQLAIRPGTGRESRKDAIARINAIKIGSLALLFLPGEPFIETAFDIEKASPFEHIIIMGFSENNIGYIPTATAFEEGGYEAGPGKWSFLEKGSDQIVFNEAVRLLNKLYNK